MSIANQIRQGARAAILGIGIGELRGEYYTTAKKFMTPEEIHDRKKKFLNFYEANLWAKENLSRPMRAYKCERCPFVHLTSKRVK